MKIEILKKKQKVFFIVLEYYSEKYIVEEGTVSKIYLQEDKKGYIVTDMLGTEWMFPLISNNVMFLTKENAQVECDRRNNGK